MNFFISGWAGFRQALDVPEDWHFIIPFIDLDEEGILNFFKDKSGKTLVGWSTGGHIVLKNHQFFSHRFNSIVVVSGFKKFTDYVNPRILKKMMHKMENEPETVIREFLINCGCKPVFPEDINKKALINGLEFLMNSDIKMKSSRKLILIHGKYDRVLPYKALFDLKKFFPEVETHLIEGSHWIPFKRFFSIIKKCLILSK